MKIHSLYACLPTKVNATNGLPIAGFRNRYPEAPAAGLYTNAGFTSVIQGYPNQAAGMAIMTNRNNDDEHAGSFYGEAIDAWTRIYGLSV